MTKTKRGLPIVKMWPGHVNNLLTVEAYMKWYDLILVSTNGAHEDEVHTYISYDQLEPFAPKGQSAYVDHVPNPLAVKAMAEAKGWQLDPLAFELIVGRWCTEVRDYDLLMKDWLIMSGIIEELRRTSRKAVDEIWTKMRAKYNNDLPDETRELKNYLDSLDCRQEGGQVWPSKL